jgi:ribosomal protein S18 acetylase RimI-like enzyme
MDELHSIGIIKRNTLHEASDVLAHAFQQDPLWGYFIPEEDDRVRLSRISFRMLIRYTIRYGFAHSIGSSVKGVALWLPSDKSEMSLFSEILCGGLSVLINFGPDKIGRMNAVDSFMSKLRKQQLPQRHWYLSLLGVAPDEQGKGYASLLMRHMVEKLEADKMPAYLDTQNARNVSIYERFGFRIIDEVIIPGTEITHWAMIRE